MKLFPFSNKTDPHLRTVGIPLMQDAPYRDADDRLKHRHSIERLAEEVHRSVSDVAPLYENVLAHLRVRALIHDYLPILVSKNVKRFFKKHY